MNSNEILEFMESLRVISKGMESGIYDFTENGHCSNCGQCCSRFLPISEKEKKTIRRYMKKHGIKEQKHLLPTAQPVEDWTCPFRCESERKCLIYEVRPAICRDFRCDKPQKKIEASKKLYHGKYDAVDMRKEFFGGGNK